MACLAMPGTVDVDHWLAWMTNTRQAGLVAGYAANAADYPPLASVLLWLIASVADRLEVGYLSALNVGLALCLGLTTLLWLAWTRDALLAAGLGLALVINSVGHAYLDIFIAPSLLLALWALARHRWGWFAFLFALTCLIKWQPLIIAPFLGLYALRGLRPPLAAPMGLLSPRSWMQTPGAVDGLTRLTLTGVLPVLGAVAVFGPEVWVALGRAMAHPYLSGNALNFNWLLTHWLLWRDDALTGGLAHFILVNVDHWPMTLWPRLMFTGLYAASLWACFRRAATFDAAIAYALAGYLAYFTFNTGVHENHLFLAVLLAAVLAWSRRAWGWFLVMALAANFNHLIFYGLDGTGSPAMRAWHGLDLALPLAALFVVVFTSFIVRLGKMTTD